MVDWVVIVPIKRFTDAKRRLEGVRDRAAVAEALTRDTLQAVASSRKVRMVLVMTDDPLLVEDLRLPVAAVVRTQERPGLNGAIADGLAYAGESWPDFGVAVLQGDLPALTAEDLDAVLESAEEVPLGLVPDANGTGTAMITGKPGVPLLPAFGEGSAARHQELGHKPIRAPERLRRDVDTRADLHAAVRLGVGRHTAQVLGLPAVPDSAA
jgi:2-phospho-L-lactate guanylyltransferase